MTPRQCSTAMYTTNSSMDSCLGCSDRAIETTRCSRQPLSIGCISVALAGVAASVPAVFVSNAGPYAIISKPVSASGKHTPEGLLLDPPDSLRSQTVHQALSCERRTPIIEIDRFLADP
jgi:hypothetical protein